MPEEVNRVLVDRLSTLLFAPGDVAVANLRAEGMTEGVHEVGDVMHDACLTFAPIARERSTALADAGVEPGGYVLATVHREANARPEPLRAIAAALGSLGEPVVFPAHPRTRAVLEDARDRARRARPGNPSARVPRLRRARRPGARRRDRLGRRCRRRRTGSASRA